MTVVLMGNEQAVCLVVSLVVCSVVVKAYQQVGQ